VIGNRSSVLLAGGIGIDSIDGIAAGKGAGSVERATGQRASGGAAHVRLNVRSDRTGCGELVLFQSPLLLGGIDLAEIIHASIGLRAAAGFYKVGNGDCSQHTNDGNDDHDFNQGETGFTSNIILHNYVSFFS